MVQVLDLPFVAVARLVFGLVVVLFLVDLALGVVFLDFAVGVVFGLALTLVLGFAFGFFLTFGLGSGLGCSEGAGCLVGSWIFPFVLPPAALIFSAAR